MDTSCEYLSYESTGVFSKLMIDYLNGDPKLAPFYNYPVSLEGIKLSIEARKKFDTPRRVLVEVLQSQYKGITLHERQAKNLQLLLEKDTFTICTAHQPNIFTGPLFFIYKILHVIKLADELNEQLPEMKFVPVYYMGSEDADLDELGHIFLNGQKLEWQTEQTGAVGRMKVDKQLIALINNIAGQVEVTPNGKEIIKLFREAYTEGELIQQATLKVVDKLFREFGLLILIPDNRELKRQFIPVLKNELLEQFSHPLVQQTCDELSRGYKVQASGRELNLFYLDGDKRERIEKVGEKYTVPASGKSWLSDEILTEVNEYPERFSPNVILRGVFQESILPNIAFIGGGGETAYWLELKRVFSACNVPFPMLILRNSFLITNSSEVEKCKRLGIEITDLFLPVEKILSGLVQRESKVQLDLDNEKRQLDVYYDQLKQVAVKIDFSLGEHIESLKISALKKIEALEKKMMRAEKRKFEAQQRQITSLKNKLFPVESLQERHENISSFYGFYGKRLIAQIYDSSLGLDQKFAILQMD